MSLVNLCTKSRQEGFDWQQLSFNLEGAKIIKWSFFNK